MNTVQTILINYLQLKGLRTRPQKRAKNGSYIWATGALGANNGLMGFVEL